MTILPFIKMHAQGNDFVILDGRKHKLPEPNRAFIRTIAERRYGIGCDQVLILMPDKEADAFMRIFNNDGSEAENCGNGLRCVGKILLEETDASSVHIRLNDRKVLVEKGENGLRVHMGAARILETARAHIDVDMGNPHRVFFEATEEFPHDRNIEIVSGRIGDDVYVDIIERGVGHTPACGTGACAVAAAIWSSEKHQHPLNIHMPGGEVRISGTMKDLVLEGEVRTVFAGQYELGEKPDES
jgi:diaminopimelate epimerase